MNQKLVIYSVLTLMILTLSACHKTEPAKTIIYSAMVVHPTSADVMLNSYTGDVTARFQPILSFRVGGKVTKRWVDIGDTVKKGQILAELDPQDANLQRANVQAQLTSAESSEQIAKAELARYKQLLAPKAISRSQYDQVENQYKTAVAALAQAQSQFNLANNQTDYNTLRAPENGTIIQRNIEAGQVVAAGQAVYTLAAQGEREVLIGLSEKDAPRMRVGQAVTVTVWTQPDVRFAAHIREISPAADESRTYAARIAFNQANPAVDIGQSARVYTNQAQAKSTLSLPLPAITAEQGAAYVWVLNTSTSRVKRMPIQVGTYSRDSASVLSGLKPSDWVVVAGVQLLHDGQQINAVDRQNRPVHASASLSTQQD